MHPKRTERRTSLFFASYGMLIFGLGINYLLNIYIGRTLGPKDYGVYAFGLNIYNIMVLITVFSLDQAALRFIPQTNSKHLYTGVIVRYSISIVCLSALIGFFLLVSLPIDNILLYSVFLVAMVPSVLLVHVLAIAQANHILISRMSYRYLVEPLMRSVGLLILFFFWSKEPVSVSMAILIAGIVTLIAAYIHYRDLLSWSLAMPYIHPLKAVGKFILPLSVSNVFNVIAGRVDILVIGALVVSAQLGVYTAALQTAAMIAIVLQGIELVYASLLSKSIGNNDIKQLKKDYSITFRMAVLLGAPVVVFLAFYEDLITVLFGAEYKGSSLVLAILCISQFVNLATGSANQILILFGRARTVLILNVTFLLFVVLGVYFGVSTLGVVGAALGVMFSSVMLNILRVLILYYRYRIQPYDKKSSIYIVFLTAMLVWNCTNKEGFDFLLSVLVAIIVLAIGLLMLVNRDEYQNIFENVSNVKQNL